MNGQIVHSRVQINALNVFYSCYAAVSVSTAGLAALLFKQFVNKHLYTRVNNSSGHYTGATS